MSRVTQEFYCRNSGGGCGGYFLAKINTALNGVHNIICPNCQHQHQRSIKDGKIVGEGRSSSKPVDEIYAPKSTWRKEPFTKVMKTKGETEDAVIISNPQEVSHDISHWIEVFGDRV